MMLVFIIKIKENKIFENISPRLALSLSLSRNNKWNLNMTSGRYYKMPTYTSLGFRDLNNILTNKNSKYTRSDHLVIGLEFINSESSRFTVELFDKRYSNYPVSSTDMVSLANKGGDFEVLGNEKTKLAIITKKDTVWIEDTKINASKSILKEISKKI